MTSKNTPENKHTYAKLILLVFAVLLLVGTASASVLVFHANGTTGDGQLKRAVTSETFPAILTGVGTGLDNTTVTATIAGLQAHASTSGNYISFMRGGWTSDTSAIPDNAVIDSANFSVMIMSLGAQLGNPGLGITQFTPSSTSLLISDYEKVTSVRYAADKAFASLAANTWAIFPLTNLTFINKTGYTSLALRTPWDIDNSTTGITWGASKYSIIKINQTVAADSTIPNLTVFYTIPPTTVTYTANTTSGTSPLIVALTGASTGDAPTTWKYYATNVTGNNVEYLLSASQSPTISLTTGNFSVKLVGTNEAGSTNSSAAWINVSPPAPVASFTMNRGIVQIPQPVIMTDTSTNTPTGWQWNFGDGNLTNATVPNPQYTYRRPGIMTISETITNTAGTSTTSQRIFVMLHSAQLSTLTQNVSCENMTYTSSRDLDEYEIYRTNEKILNLCI